MSKINKRIFVAITGASGAIYAESLIQKLITQLERVYVCFTKTATQVVNYELDVKEDSNFSLKFFLNKGLTSEQKGTLRFLDSDDFFAPSASGSAKPDAMIIIPCSMGTLARISQGISSNLIERVADVMLKEKKQLIICPRETPLNKIHLRNMLSLAEMGVHIIPAMPAFYQRPKTVDDLVNFMVGRVLEQLDIKHDLYLPWNHRRL